jgi:glutathione S-transferase
MSSTPILHIGNKNYSSWSLRPWLVLRWGEIPFDEHLIPLGGEGYGRAAIPAVVAISPTGKVPALELPTLTVWDSLAIAEWAAEQNPTLWPQDADSRALARSAVAEMHSAFVAIRRDLSMNIRRRRAEPPFPTDTQRELVRLRVLLEGLLSRSGGPWLMGSRTIVDAFFAPVATRLRTYGVAVSPVIGGWMDTLFADPDFREWEKAGAAEAWVIDDTEALWP